MPVKKALFLCSGKEGRAERLLLHPLLVSLQEAEYEVEYFAPQDFTLLPDVHKISWHVVVEFPGLRWLYHTFVLPFIVVQYCVARRYSVIVSADPYLLFVSWFASLLIVAKRVLLLNGNLKRQRSYLTRHILGFQDFLGMLSSSAILVPTTATKNEVGRLASVLEDKVIKLPITISCLPADKLIPADELDRSRRTIFANYDLTERTTVFVARIDDVSFETIVRCLRLFTAIGNSKRALFLLGENTRQNALMSIVMGLGLSERVIFIDSFEESDAVVCHADICFIFDERDSSSYWMNLARAHNAIVIPFGDFKSELAIGDYQLIGDVSKDTETIEQLFLNRESLAEIRQKQQKIEPWESQNWGLAARGLLGL